MRIATLPRQSSVYDAATTTFLSYSRACMTRQTHSDLGVSYKHYGKLHGSIDAQTA